MTRRIKCECKKELFTRGHKQCALQKQGKKTTSSWFVKERMRWKKGRKKEERERQQERNEGEEGREREKHCQPGDILLSQVRVQFFLTQQYPLISVAGTVSLVVSSLRSASPSNTKWKSVSKLSFTTFSLQLFDLVWFEWTSPKMQNWI